jgi:hypothetical protein
MRRAWSKGSEEGEGKRGRVAGGGDGSEGRKEGDKTLVEKVSLSHHTILFC